MNTKTESADSGVSPLDLEFITGDLREIGSVAHMCSTVEDGGGHQQRAFSMICTSIQQIAKRLDDFEKALRKGGAS